MLFDHPEFDAHELVQFVEDEPSGLRAIIALHSTTLGPAAGGIRFHPYPSETLALTDVLRLSRAMTAKMAFGEVPMGGGKSVIIGDPRSLKSVDLLHAFGRAVDRLGGRYICGEDMGMTPEDMDVVATETRWATGRASGSGDTSPLTAVTVFDAVRAAAIHLWGPAGLEGRVVAVQGLGAVGGKLARRLVEVGVRVVGSDPDPARAAEAAARGITLVDPGEILAAECDILAPCAFGGVLSAETIPTIRAEVVCGAANNQLATSKDADRLAEAGILYVPDYAANIGGVYSGVIGLKGKTAADAQALADRVFPRVLDLLDEATRLAITPSEAADRVVADRLRAGSAWVARQSPSAVRRARRAST